MNTPTSARSMIAPKSPLSLVGVFLEILRSRFSPQNAPDLPWQYLYGDVNRTESDLTIEAGQNAQTEYQGHRPGIFVMRGPISMGQVAIADHLATDAKKSIKVYYSIAQTNFTFACEAEAPAEAEIIADIVLSTLMMGADQIQDTFNFRKLGPFSISSRAQTRQDTDLTQVTINMGLSYDIRWATQDIAPVLSEVVVKAKHSDYTNSDQFFSEIYQLSLAKRPKSTS